MRFLIAFLLLMGTAWAQTGTIERVIDGGTIVVAGERVTIWGIQLPEPGTERGDLASRRLGMLVDTIGDRAVCRPPPVHAGQTAPDGLGRQCFISGLDLGGWLVDYRYAEELEQVSGGYYAREPAQARRAASAAAVKPIRVKVTGAALPPRNSAARPRRRAPPIAGTEPGGLYR